MLGLRVFLWSAAGSTAVHGAVLPSAECLRISLEGVYETPNWTYTDDQVDPSTSLRQWHEDRRSFLVYSKAGKYEGAEAIHEYNSFGSTKSILIESAPILLPRSGVGYVKQYDRTVIDPNGRETLHTMCSYLQAGLLVGTFNSSMVADAFNYGTFTVKLLRLMRYEYSMTDNKLHGTWLWFEDDAVAPLGPMAAASLTTLQYLCNLIRTKCPEVWALNNESYTDEEGCVTHQANTPIYDKNEVFIGRSGSCRIFHMGFASNNPRHCAHLSTIPLADPNGAVKCQDEEYAGPQYYPPSNFFSDEEVEFAKHFGRRYGLFTGNVGGAMPVFNMATAFDPIVTTEITSKAVSLSISSFIVLSVMLR